MMLLYLAVLLTLAGTASASLTTDYSKDNVEPAVTNLEDPKFTIHSSNLKETGTRPRLILQREPTKDNTCGLKGAGKYGWICDGRDASGGPCCSENVSQKKLV